MLSEIVTLKKDLNVFGINLSDSNDFGDIFLSIDNSPLIESLILVIPVSLISSFDLDRSKLFHEVLING